MYFSAPVVLISLYLGCEEIKIASVSGIVSIKARPFSAPITLTAVDKASASVALRLTVYNVAVPFTLD